MELTISINIDNALNIIKNLSNISENNRRILERIQKEVVMPEIASHIENQENPDNSKWGKVWKRPVKEPNRKALIKTGTYKTKFKSKVDGNSLKVYHEYFWAKTHEKPLAVNIFGRGVLYQFPQRSAVWLSQKAINNDIKNIIIQEIIKK
jgi:hypothetical protein